MESRKEFIMRVNEQLNKLDQTILLHNENEFWLIQQAYEYIEYYVIEKRLYNTAIALPLVRGLHNGSYRKYGVIKDGESYRLPYYIHCLLVCRMLVDLHVDMSAEDEDVLLAAALCHDLIEDMPFKNGGRELVDVYGLDERVYEVVKKVSKRKDFTIEEEAQFFDNIQRDVTALLIKLSDRGNNVEDLYNMSSKKLAEYIGETEKYFLPMSEYGLANYPVHISSIHILRDKIITLTTASEVMIKKLDDRNQKLRDERNQLKLENIRLREQWKELWEEEMCDG